MRQAGTSSGGLPGALLLLILASALGGLHARAWDLGRRSPALSFDAAQYAVAARTLAARGVLATPFALPIDLVKHPAPAWPLSVVQPGLVVLEAALDRIVPPWAPWPGGGDFSTPERREWLPLVISFACYVALGLAIARAVRRRLEALDPGNAPGHAWVAAGAGTAFLLDPEAQHLALGGFTELPYTLLLVAALAMLASGRAARRPFAWGVLLGIAGSVRGNLLGLLPVLAVAAATLAPGRRRRVAGLALLGFALPLAPWWIYKWRAFGNPGWDLSALALWDGVGGRTWFSLTHRPALPQLPSGAAGLAAVAPKALHNLPSLLAAYALDPAGPWTAVLLAALAATRKRDRERESDPAFRAARVAAWVVLAHAAFSLAVAALGAGWRRYLFPARVPVEAAGLAAAWLAIARSGALAAGRRRVLAGALVVAVAIGWGGYRTVRGDAEARAAAESRGLPSVATLRALSAELDRTLGAGELVMSNLGPTLAWFARRPVLHLSLGPEDMPACRRRVPFRRVVLAFRDPAHAWGSWASLVANPDVARSHPEWGVERARLWLTNDGFRVVWLELEER